MQEEVTFSFAFHHPHVGHCDRDDEEIGNANGNVNVNVDDRGIGNEIDDGPKNASGSENGICFWTFAFRCRDDARYDCESGALEVH